MTKLRIYIDFEAISSPFNRDLDIHEQIPFAYSLGVYIGKKFKVKTHIINFNNVHHSEVYNNIRNSISKHIKLLLNNNKFLLNKETIEFIGFDPILEKAILKNIFYGVNVIDLSKGNRISLERVTSETFGKKIYFEEFKKAIFKNLSNNFIIRRGLAISDGAIAALAGYILYTNAIPGKFKYHFYFEQKILLAELREYSRDDVLRMDIINRDYNSFLIKYKKWKNIIKEESKIKKEIKNNDIILSHVAKMNKNITVETLIEGLKKKNKKLKNRNLREDL